MAADDDRWSRDGRTLAEWLPLLVHHVPRTRRAAENAVSAMGWGAPVADVTAIMNGPADRAAHDRDFAAAVSRAILASDDDGLMLLERIVATIRTDRIERWRKTELEDQLLDLTIESAGDSPDAQAIAEEIRLMNAPEAGRLPNSHGPHTLHIVFRHAGETMLRHPDAARAWLADQDVNGDAIEAIAALGPRGVGFAPDLLARLADPASKFQDYAALAAIGREDAATIDRLASLARSPDLAVAGRARETLAAIGPAARELRPTIVDELLAGIDDDVEHRAGRLASIAAIDATRRDVFDRLLALARPALPRMRTNTLESGYAYTYDETMYDRGIAIEALARYPHFAEEIVPVLIEAIDSFEEYDPDWGYENGEHGRIVSTLSTLGPASTAAVPALVENLRTDDGIDWRIVRFFGELGPAGQAALPALRAIAAEVEPDDLDPGELPDERLEPLAWSLWRITGELPSQRC